MGSAPGRGRARGMPRGPYVHLWPGATRRARPGAPRRRSRRCRSAGESPARAGAPWPVRAGPGGPNASTRTSEHRAPRVWLAAPRSSCGPAGEQHAHGARARVGAERLGPGEHRVVTAQGPDPARRCPRGGRCSPSSSTTNGGRRNISSKAMSAGSPGCASARAARASGCRRAARSGRRATAVRAEALLVRRCATRIVGSAIQLSSSTSIQRS